MCVVSSWDFVKVRAGLASGKDPAGPLRALCLLFFLPFFFHPTLDTHMDGWHLAYLLAACLLPPLKNLSLLGPLSSPLICAPTQLGLLAPDLLTRSSLFQQNLVPFRDLLHREISILL